MSAKVIYIGHSEYCHEETCCCNTHAVSINKKMIFRTSSLSEAEKACDIINEAIAKAVSNAINK